MAFDLISFIVGIAAGGLTGTLAGVLYGFERTGDLQEKLVKLSREIDRIDLSTPTSNTTDGAREKMEMRELRADLDSIHEEIRKMYRKTTR
jgi:hypothetical protein